MGNEREKNEQKPDIVEEIFFKNDTGKGGGVSGKRVSERKKSKKASRSREEKILIAVTVLSCFGLLIGVVRIYGAMHITIDGPNSSSQYTLSGGENALNDYLVTAETASGGKDTDNDGLSDYDEANIYGTSPYLEDTDSDGVSDYDEIQRGTDPVCLFGASCAGASPLGAQAAVATDTGITPPPSVTPEYLRNFLMQSGVENSFLDSMSDSEIMNIYASTQAELSSDLEIPQEDPQAASSVRADDLRELMRENGMTEEMLSQFSDEEILRTFDTIANEE